MGSYQAIATTVCLILLCSTVSGAGEGAQRLSSSERLSETIVFRDVQYGFAGATGEVLTIRTNGAWELARFLNEETEKPHRTGHLTEGQCGALRKALDAHKLSTLPSNFGREVAVNAHRLQLSFGGKTSSLNLDAGESIEDAAPAAKDAEAEAWVRFLAIAQRLRELVEGDQKAAKESYIRVEAVGRLRQMKLVTEDGEVPLKWHKPAKSQPLFQILDNRRVVIKGSLRVKRDDRNQLHVEVSVISLRAAP